MNIPVSRRELVSAAKSGAITLAIGGGLARISGATAQPAATGAPVGQPAATSAPARVCADPTHLPPPIHRRTAMHHAITLDVKEVVAEIAPGATFRFMTFGGQVPGPMIRVRQGDTITLTLRSAVDSLMIHNVDMHAIYGTGGGAPDTMVGPGQSSTETFKAVYPGAFIYHCAVPGFLDQHISSGMFGMILVEPENGLAKVDREFYLGQHEVYTDQGFNEPGLHGFDFSEMAREQPNFVLFNGAVNGLTTERYGAMQAKVGERVRVFMVCGGPNLTSSFHPIGNVWSRAWPQGALANPALRYLQTQSVPPGSCFVGEMDLPVPETVNLVDHALSRVVHKGLLAQIEVKGAPNPAVFRKGA